MTEFKNEFSWSPARRRRFNDCKRRYYYHHYGSWGGWEDDAGEQTKLIYRLKNMSNIPMFAGKVVHDTISSVLDELKAGMIVEQEKAEEKVVKSFKQGWGQSKREEWRGSPKWKTNLFEHYYDEVPSQDELKDVGDKLVKCIDGFYASESFAYIKSIPSVDWICKEELASFDFEGTKVFVSLDFAARHGQRVYIYDWKTGKQVYEDEIQLAVYAIYAIEEWGIDLSNLRLFDVYLQKRMPVKVKVNEPTIEETMRVMRESIAEMKATLDHPEENVASLDNFPMIENGTVCNRCQFKGICYPDSWKDLTT